MRGWSGERFFGVMFFGPQDGGSHGGWSHPFLRMGGGWIARDSLNHLPSRLVRMPAPPSYPLPFSEEDGGMGPRMASHGAKATTPKMHGLSILSLLERESLHSAP
jgi:hypothetical protein